MKKLIISSLIIVSFLLSGCSKTEISDLKFYVIDRNLIDMSMTDSQIVSKVEKAGRLAYDGDDIEGYNWETHTLFFKQDSVSSHGAVTQESGGSKIFKVDDTYAFVITIGKKLVLYGGFEQGSKNPSVPLQPYISDEDKYVVKLKFDSKYASFSDNRSNLDLYNFLNNYGLLISNTK